MPSRGPTTLLQIWRRRFKPSASIALRCMCAGWPWSLFTSVGTCRIGFCPPLASGCPVDPHQRGLTVAATSDPVKRKWCFWVYTGLLYGLASAVLSFNRLPTLVVAAARRLLAVACGAYFGGRHRGRRQVRRRSSAVPAPPRTSPRSVGPRPHAARRCLILGRPVVRYARGRASARQCGDAPRAAPGRRVG